MNKKKQYQFKRHFKKMGKCKILRDKRCSVLFLVRISLERKLDVFVMLQSVHLHSVEQQSVATLAAAAADDNDLTRLSILIEICSHMIIQVQ